MLQGGNAFEADVLFIRRVCAACYKPVGAPGAKRLLLLVEKNPSVLSAAFDVNEFVEPSFTTRVKMGQSSNVLAVALMADGRVLYAQKEVKVTLGGCGG